MATPTPSIAHILQEAYILATGRTASSATQARFETLVTQGNGYSLVAREIDTAMGQLAAANGVTATVQAIALNGLGLSLSQADAAAVTASLMARGIDSWSKLFEFCINLQDSGGVALDNRADAGLAFNTQLAGLGKGALFSGAAMDAAVRNLVQNIGASASSVANGQSGLDALAAKLTSAGIQSSVVDGYVAGAKVFVDVNGDGVLNAGEYSAVTDAGGGFVLPLSTAAGNLFASGGTDLLTNKPFKGTLIAAAGSTVINPLTTMVQALLIGGQAASVAQATAIVQQALGLPANINLLSYDALAVLASPTASAADKAAALGVQRVALQLANVITQTSVVIDAAKAAVLPAGSASGPSAALSVIAALASTLAAATAPGGTGTVNLSSSATLTGVIAAAATNAGAASVAANASRVALVTSASNASAAGAATLTDLAKAAVVSQGAATDALAAGATAGSLDAAISAFTGASLATAIAAATPGTVSPGVNTGTSTPVPPPTFAVSKDAGNVVSFTAAGTQVSVSEAGGTYTFTSTGGSAGSGTASGTITGIAVPAATTLLIGSALASGKTFSGTGTALVLASASGEDLTAFTATGVTGFALTSGQNYTLTAAQAAIGRIGTGGAAGALTDAGTITVRDTVAALGAGIAATLKANGADSVIAAAAPADISAINVTGIDSIVLAAGSYTMTAVQSALANATTGAQTVTLTTLASGTLNAGIESFVLGNFANSVTLGAAAQNVTGPAGTATTLAIAGTAPTGTWALAHASGDTLVAANGASIAGVNGGAATTAESLTLTGGITMTRVQHEALAIAAAGGADSVTITTSGTVTARAGVESYVVAQGVANTVTVAAPSAGVNITGGATGTASVDVGGTTVTGTWALGGANDVLIATAGAGIAAVNAGLATTAENLVLTGAISMTQAQHQAFASVAAAGGADAVAITSGGAVTAAAAIEAYSVSGGGANSITVNAGKTDVNLTGASANATTVIVGGNAVSGTWALSNAADAIVATTGANISGVNGGAATTAENLTLTGGITMTQAQHAALAAVTAAGGSDFIVISDGGTVTARAGVETYTVSGGGSNNVTVLAGTNVNGVTSNATTISVGGNTVTGTYTVTHTADVLDATTGANIAGAGTGTVERLTLAGTVTMTATQYNTFNGGGITAAGGSDKVVLTTALNGAQTLNAAIETFALAAATNSVTLGAAQSIDAQALTSAHTLSLAGGFAATVSLTDGNLTSTATGAVTATAGTGNNTLTLGGGDDTVNAGSGNDFITGGAGADTLNGEDGNDSFFYASVADFITGDLVVDRIDGGNGTDSAVIAGTIALTASSDLRRMTTVEQLGAQSQSSTAHAHGIAIGSDTLLGDVRTIDLSGDTRSTSTASLDVSGVTRAMTLKGVGTGTNSFFAGTGADTMTGGSASDTFFFKSAAHAAGDTVDGGGGSNYVVFASTAAATLSVTNSFTNITAYSITTNAAGFGTSDGTTSENIDASGYTSGGVVLNGNAGANRLTGTSSGDTIAGSGGADTIRGGGGNDTLSGAGATFQFEASGSANGNDTLALLTSNKMDFTAFLGRAGAVSGSVVDANLTTVLTLNSDNIGVRYGSTNVSTGQLSTAATGVAGNIVLADNGNAVVLAFGANNSSQTANSGTIYYISDVDPTAGTSFLVIAVGTIQSANMSVISLAAAGYYV